MKIIERTHDVITNEITDAEVTLTAAEAAERTKAQADLKAAKQAALDLAALKASAKAKLIAGEPLTAAEADTLVI